MFHSIILGIRAIFVVIEFTEMHWNFQFWNGQYSLEIAFWSPNWADISFSWFYGLKRNLKKNLKSWLPRMSWNTFLSDFFFEMESLFGLLKQPFWSTSQGFRPLAHLRGPLWTAPPSRISFIFMHFSAKILPNNRLAPETRRWGTPPWEILDPLLSKAMGSYNFLLGYLESKFSGGGVVRFGMV